AFKYHKVAIVGKHYKKEVIQMVETLYAYLKQQGLEIIVENDTAADTSLVNVAIASLKEIALRCDVAIEVGGDCNFLKASRLLAL
ncbi:NAD(+) kinase, partial [Francisella tularensis subsp. holarctica]|uniref:NAD(+)/NADH kinase n=1 Tax=Francisella tularensis TaxID=263 RepID=UPI0023AC2C70|nr:NAD(+) kinase [Francisella tularensis subsp. holarctica]